MAKYDLASAHYVIRRDSATGVPDVDLSQYVTGVRLPNGAETPEPFAVRALSGTITFDVSEPRATCVLCGTVFRPGDPELQAVVMRQRELVGLACDACGVKYFSEREA